MKSLEELQKIKERALQRRKLSGEGTRARIIVAMGTCGIAAGARDTMAAILKTLEEKKITDVTVTQTGCMGLCEYEPIVQVKVGEEDLITYGHIDVNRVPELIEKHLIGGEPMEAWIIQPSS
ncbi:MAG: (2Fe-2S) ferredoxin domain-containing protein [Anaerolineae bacterium]|nr:(2Fe-2S) ferredoxin domain-containing protein [Anaerolineae bacterium]